MKIQSVNRSSHRDSVFSSSLIVGLAAIAFSACGGSSSGSPAETVPADVGLEVDAGPGIKFAATSYTAAAGDVKVAYRNVDAQRHTLAIIAADGTTLPGELEVFKSGDIDVRSYTLAIGTYKLICTVPGHENMKATLDVK